MGDGHDLLYRVAREALDSGDWTANELQDTLDAAVESYSPPRDKQILAHTSGNPAPRV